jgi:type III restriction enzyme
MKHSCSRPVKPTRTVQSIHSAVKYDLIGKIAEGTQLTRRTTADILKGIKRRGVCNQFRTNPESFIAEGVRLINEQKATMIIEHLAYDPVEDKFDIDIFTAGQTKQDFNQAKAASRLPDSHPCWRLQPRLGDSV